MKYMLSFLYSPCIFLPESHCVDSVLVTPPLFTAFSVTQSKIQ